ncbi:MAG: hypothetical protein Q7T25_09470, partial [Sideroxyarcus sp.]|nr:hypothetical protein [Sideroxyarcus sp.]
CTACPMSNYQNIAVPKHDWVRRNVGHDLLLLAVWGGRNKWLFMQQPGDILIDDFEKNLTPWNDAGGVGILHQGDFEATKTALRKIILPKAQAA